MANFFFRAMAALVAILLVVSFALVLAGFLLPWVEGNPAGVDVKVGVFEQCVDAPGQDQACRDISFGDINIDLWTGAAVLFIIGLGLLVIDIILFFLSVCFCRIVIAAKIILAFANIMFMVAIILVPLGFAFLDDSCPTGNEVQCSLTCNGGNSFSFFTLCDPFELGDGLIVLVTGLFLQFFTSLLAGCLQLKNVVVTEKAGSRV